MFAAVDLGSNSFRLHIGDPVDGDAGAEMRIVRSARDPVRLAAGLSPDGALSEDAMCAAVRSLEGFRAVLGEYRLDGVRVVATNTLRVASNAAELLPLLEKALGYPIDIISGEEEGRLIYMGVQRALGSLDGKRLVIDIGGGSTEVVAGRGERIEHVESFSVGTQPQAAFFAGGAIDDAAFDAATTAARAVFEDAAPAYRALGWDAVYGSSGTMRAMAEVIDRNAFGDGTLSPSGLAALRAALVACRRVEDVDLPGLKRERVVAVLGGLSVLAAAMEEFGVRRVEAIGAGLRLGVLSDLALRAGRRDRRADAVEDCMRRFGVDRTRAGRSAALAGILYRKLAPQDHEGARYLDWSCRLHEVGQAISHTGAHKHGAYIVGQADLPGFTASEQRLMAGLVLGQKGNLRKVRQDAQAPGPARMLLAMRLAVACLHARADAEADALGLRMDAAIRITTPAGWLERHPTLCVWLDKERAAWSEVGVELSVATA